MAYTVSPSKTDLCRKGLSARHLTGLGITIRHFVNILSGQKEGHHAIPGGKMGPAITTLTTAVRRPL